MQGVLTTVGGTVLGVKYKHFLTYMSVLGVRDAALASLA